MSAYRVKVERTVLVEGGPWLARLVPVTEPGVPPIVVGSFPTQPEAVQRGITALRFVAAGIPWRTPEAARPVSIDGDLVSRAVYDRELGGSS